MPDVENIILEQGAGWSRWRSEAFPNASAWGDGVGRWEQWFLALNTKTQWLCLSEDKEGEAIEPWDVALEDLARIEMRGQEVGFLNKRGEWLTVASVEDAAGLCASIARAVKEAKALNAPPPPVGFDI
jgi:hypothetical protein